MIWPQHHARLIAPTKYLILMMIGAFLAPFIGPLIDHNYAEKQPLHQHLYLDSIILLHHGHHQADDIISLPSLNMANSTSLAPFLPYTQAINLSRQPSSELTFGLLEESSISQGISPPPLDRPPR